MIQDNYSSPQNAEKKFDAAALGDLPSFDQKKPEEKKKKKKGTYYCCCIISAKLLFAAS